MGWRGVNGGKKRTSEIFSIIKINFKKERHRNNTYNLFKKDLIFKLKTECGQMTAVSY